MSRQTQHPPEGSPVILDNRNSRWSSDQYSSPSSTPQPNTTPVYGLPKSPRPCHARSLASSPGLSPTWGTLPPTNRTSSATLPTPLATPTLHQYSDSPRSASRSRLLQTPSASQSRSLSEPPPEPGPHASHEAIRPMQSSNGDSLKRFGEKLKRDLECCFGRRSRSDVDESEEDVRKIELVHWTEL